MNLREGMRMNEVMKRGVGYRVPGGMEARFKRFYLEEFRPWEEETFGLFEAAVERLWKRVDPEGVMRGKGERLPLTALDLGAWIGPTTVWLAQHFRHVVAVEPDPVAVQGLMQMLEANELLDRVSLVQAPVSVWTGAMVKMVPHEGVWGGSMTRTEAEGCGVMMRTVGLMELHRMMGAGVGMVKCDIEGAEGWIVEELMEGEAWRGCERVISYHLPWWKSQEWAAEWQVKLGLADPWGTVGVEGS